MEVLEKISSGLYSYTGLKFFNLEKMAYVLGLTQTALSTRYRFSGMSLHIIPCKTEQIIYANITKATTRATY